jgi:hypothetical protein
MTVDPSFTARDGSEEGGNTSDESAIAVGFREEFGSVHILDCVHGRFKGMALPDRIVDAQEQWSCAIIKIERNPNFDLLSDAIKLRGAMREVIIPRIVPFVPIHSKRHRISRLQSLLEERIIQIQNGKFIQALLEQAENFCFKDSQNHRHEDGMLDVISMQAGFR